HAHGLIKSLGARLLDPEEVLRRMDEFEVAVRYQMYHALGLVLLGLLAIRSGSCWLTTAGILFIAGTLLFCGCLYIPVLTGTKLPWFLVPSGGLAFILGWLALAVGAGCACSDSKAVDQLG